MLKLIGLLGKTCDSRAACGTHDFSIQPMLFDELTGAQAVAPRKGDSYPSRTLARMDRAELIRVLVLNTIADDYENEAIIVNDVNRCLADSQLAPLARDEIQKSLVGLIGAGLALAYRLSPCNRPTEALAGVPLPNEMDDFWFFITKQGRISMNAAASLFDDNGKIVDFQ